jgi:GTP-binding protein
MKITSAIFDASAVSLASCPEPGLPEFALIGRSNVGKSTLLNRIAEKKDLARVSDTPGFTKTINFFTLNRRWRLVDLPGYGFAKASMRDRALYAQMIEDYILNRQVLACVFVLVDSSIPPQGVDLDFVQWVGRAGKPFAIVFTKADKAKGNKAVAHVEQFMQAIAEWFEEPPLMFTTSATSQTGIRDLQALISEALIDLENHNGRAG